MSKNTLMINRNIGFLLILDRLEETASYNKDVSIDFYYEISNQEQETIEKSYRFFYPDQSIITENGILIANFLELIACKIEKELEITELEYKIIKEIFKWQGINYIDLKTKKVK